MGVETEETKVIEYDDGSKIIETVTTQSEFVEPEGGYPAVEVSEVIADEVTDAAVQIAQIEADRDVTLAIIEGESRVAAIEAHEETGEDEWRRNIENQLAETNRSLSEVTAALTSLIQPPSPQVEVNQAETPPAPESVEVTQASPEQAAEPAPEPPKRPKKSRWI